MRRVTRMLARVCSRINNLSSLRLKEPFSADAGSRSARRRRFSCALAVGAWVLVGALPAFAAVQTVINTQDSGPGSLRNAITAAASGDTIQFAPGLTGTTITLTSGELLINKNLTITGPGASQLAISGNNANPNSASGVFIISSGANVTLSGLTIENGGSTSGGGIYNQGTLTLTNSVVSDNVAGDLGGGILNTGTLTVTDSTVSGNLIGTVGGGGIYNQGTLTVTDSTFESNSANNGNGGGIYNRTGGTVTVTASTFVGNGANNGSGGGIYNQGTLTVKSTLFAYSLGGNCGLAAAITSQGYNVSDDNSCSSAFTAAGDENNVVKGAGLDPTGLHNNGGPTPTIALLPTSPAVDHVPVANCTVTTDQRGVMRPQGPACDVGAFELVESGPTISKSFAPTTIALNGATTLRFTVSAPNGNLLTNVGFTDTLPSGLAVASPPGLTGSCSSGAITAPAGAGAVSLSGATLAAGASCTFSVTVVGTAVGVQLNTVTATSAQGASSSPGTASVTVTMPPPPVLPPTLAKAFAPTLVGLNENSTLTFTLTNPNATAFLTAAFFDNLPTGLVVATPNGVSSTCPAGAITALAGSRQIALSGGGIAPASSCTISVQVTATAAGTLVNTTTPVTSGPDGTGNAATASLTVSSDAYQVNYASNLNIADGVVNLSNSGSSALAGTPLVNRNSVGDLCVNVYVYAPDQELAACCTCLVSPNSLHAFPVIYGPNSLLSNVNNTSVLTSLNQTHSVVIKLLAVPAANQDGVAPTCPSPAAPGTGVTPGGAVTGLATGLAAWGTHAHPTNTATAAVTETRFVPAALSAGELGKLTGDCQALLTFGSGQQCPGCLTGGLAAPAALTPQLP